MKAYTTHRIPIDFGVWAERRATHLAVAHAIDQLAEPDRPVDAIWDAPTMREWTAIEEYCRQAAIDGRHGLHRLNRSVCFGEHVLCWSYGDDNGIADA